MAVNLDDLEDLNWESSYYQEPNEVVWARGRRPYRTYIHRSFTLGIPGSRDYGSPARYIVKVFDESPSSTLPDSVSADERTEDTLQTTPGGRKQVKVQIARTAGEVREIVIQEVPSNGDETKLRNILTLRRDGAARLVELMRLIQHVPVEGDQSVRLDDQVLRDVLADPSALNQIYERDPREFARVIEQDSTAEDVVAIAHRKSVVQRFRRLLDDRDYFEEARRQVADQKKETVWQQLLEANPWILGVGLTGHLLTSWDNDKLEKVVAGFSVASAGKRTDALLRTNGRISSLVFAEIKHHETELVDHRKAYRSACWAPSSELTGAAVQVQQTVYAATRQIGERLTGRDSAGYEDGSDSYLVSPQSFLVVGDLGEFTKDGRVHPDKYRSFELFRRNLQEPEVVTFDELLARAEWNVNARPASESPA